MLSRTSIYPSTGYYSPNCAIYRLEHGGLSPLSAGSRSQSQTKSLRLPLPLVLKHGNGAPTVVDGTSLATNGDRGSQCSMICAESLRRIDK